MADNETKDVHTASGGTFETKSTQPGYHPAAVPNADQTNAGQGEQTDGETESTGEQDASGSGTTSGSGSTSGSSTTRKSTTTKKTS